MRRTEENTRKNKVYGAIATGIYVVAWVLLFLFVSFQVGTPLDQSEGILINFGTTETGFGENDLAVSDEFADAAEASQAASEQTPVEQLTQDFEEAPPVSVKPEEKKPTPTETEKPKPVEETPVETPREVNQKALFPGRTQNSTSTSEGTATGQGNQGNPAGDPTGSHDGSGQGTSGNSYDLTGRSLIGTLPVPAYTVREEGRVIIEIHVDQQGKVTRTSFRSRGSTTTNATLVSAAERAAKQARFNVDETAPFPQVGTITYNFRMR